MITTKNIKNELDSVINTVSFIKENLKDDVIIAITDYVVDLKTIESSDNLEDYMKKQNNSKWQILAEKCVNSGFTFEETRKSICERIEKKILNILKENI